MCVCVRMCAYVCVCVRVCAFVWICVRSCAFVCVYLYLCALVFASACMCVCLYVCMHVCVCVCVCTHTCVSMCRFGCFRTEEWAAHVGSCLGAWSCRRKQPPPPPPTHTRIHALTRKNDATQTQFIRTRVTKSRLRVLSVYSILLSVCRALESVHKTLLSGP